MDEYCLIDMLKYVLIFNYSYAYLNYYNLPRLYARICKFLLE